eukprot:c17306_g1_i1 orf=462-1790(-)
MAMPEEDELSASSPSPSGSPSPSPSPSVAAFQGFRRFSFFFSNNSRKFALLCLAGPPPAASTPACPPSILLARDRLSSSVIPQSFQAAFGEGGRCKGEKIYTARDVALGLIDVFGWSVKVDGKGEVGKVVDIVHIGREGDGEGTNTPYEYLLKVVRPLSTKEKSSNITLLDDSANTCNQFTVLEIKILIPIVDEFMQQIDAKRRHLVVKPPAGLLELAARPEAINRLQPEIRLFCKRYASFLQERFSGNRKIKCNGISDYHKIVYSYMPTRDQLFAVGRSDLVRRIKDAGGFLYVANALGLKTTRRPNGFWDDLQRLDFEIECFLLESWVKQVHKETGITYFENPVTNEVTMEKPSHYLNGKSLSVHYDHHSGSKVMPRQKLLGKAGRWDLHHAIVWNGGYREVAHLLGRTLIRSSKKWSRQQADTLNGVIAGHVKSREGAP